MSYRISMEIALHDRNVAAVLSRIMTHMTGMAGLQRQVAQGFQQWRFAILSVGAAFASSQIFTHMNRLIDKGNEWVRLTRNMQTAGVSMRDNLDAQRKAMEVSRTYRNISSVDALKIINDQRMTLGSQALATEHAMPVLGTGAFLRAYLGHEEGKSFEGLEKELVAAIKSSEIAGKVSPEDMTRHLRQLAAMRVAFGDQVKISQYLTAQRTAGVAMRNVTDEFRYGWFPALVQENGANAGTMLMTAFNKIVAGTGNRTKAVEKMVELGLVEGSGVDYDKVGRVKGLLDPSAIKDNMGAALNMGDWVIGTLKPLLDKKLDKELAEGLKLRSEDKKLPGSLAWTSDPEHLRNVREAQLIGQMWPDRNAAKAITEMLQQFQKISREAKMTAETYKEISDPMHRGGWSWLHRERWQQIGMRKWLEGSYDAQVEAFSAQWSDLLTHLGAPAVKDATAMLASINRALGGLAQTAMRHPGAARMIVDLLYGLAAGLAAVAATAGIALLLSLIGPAGWLIGGLTALGGVLLAFGNNIEWLTQKLKSLDIFGLLASDSERRAHAFVERQKARNPNRYQSGNMGSLWRNSYTGESHQGLLHDAAWTPGQSGGPKVQHIHNIYLNGRQIAQAFSESLSRASEHVTRAPTYDGTGLYTDPSIGLIGT